MSRYYYLAKPKEEEGDGELQPQWLWDDFNVFDLVDTERMPVLLDECKNLLQKNGIARYARLDIWDGPMLTYLEVKDPRSWWIKPIHAYLRRTQKYRTNVLVRAIDKVLKFIV